MTESPSAIVTSKLSKTFRRKLAVDAIEVDVPRGTIYGFLGPNGAGKTTTLRLLMGYLRPSGGTAQVLGLDPWRDAVAIRRRVGYLPGDFNLYENMRVRQYFALIAGLRRSDGMHEAERLAARLKLALDERTRTLSRGNRQKVGLIQALMDKPELLLLDEPTSGLDPIMQREVQSIFREVRAEGRTIFLSSHILPEVERVCDRVAILGDGKLLLVEEVDKLRQRAPRSVELTFHADTPSKALAEVPGVLVVEQVGPRHLHCVVQGDMDAFVRTIASLRVEEFATHEPSLEEFFLEAYRKEEAIPHAA
jgi:ABC-2 type transport system ATP-binding protein